MEERIKKFMEYKQISASELADNIGVQRSNVTHVLKARNKPSFQFIEKLLQIYPELNAKWLLLGTGPMVETTVKPRTLFDQLPVQETKLLSKPESTDHSVSVKIPETKENSLIPEQKQANAALQQPVIDESLVQMNQNKTVENPVKKKAEDYIFNSEKPIERLVVFYKDSTFKVYNPSQ